tara:strand:- start:109425 stop:110459 length:1035 start_codon:yes stop_codon:yes gene_type:complete
MNNQDFHDAPFNVGPLLAFFWLYGGLEASYDCLFVSVNSMNLANEFAKMNSDLNWDDLKVVLAIAEKGSLSGAARQLGVSHATVFRRLNDLEDHLGVELFLRDRRGYQVTTAGQEVADNAQVIATAISAVERRVIGRDLKPSGTVRLTTTDTLLWGVLSPILSRFRSTFPDIALEVIASNNLFDLSRREADIALRPATNPPEILVGKKVGVITQAIYRHRDLPVDEATNWVGPDDAMGYPPLRNWMDQNGFLAQCDYRCDTIMGMFAALRDQAGQGILPCYLGDGAQELIRVGAPIDPLATDLWLLTHPDLQRTVRIRAVLDFIDDAMRHLAPKLDGTAVDTGQ